jgi:glycosyltransferase involved in cell wall biosynthesis
MTSANLPLISAVIPTQRRPDLVVRAVRSVLAQTYANVEVVVVVDGPDPITVPMLESLREPAVHVIALTENVGGSEARNIGVREANGSWIALLDDDDEWVPKKLAKQMAILPDTAVHYCLVTCLRLERRPGQPDILAPYRTIRAGEDVSEYMFCPQNNRRHTCGPQTSGYLATKDLFLEVPFTKGLKCHQDWDWYLRAMHYRDTASFMVNEPLYIMHVELTRPRVTNVARWHLSLGWVESRKQLFTERAYISFLINDIMYRCDETSKRLQIFRILLTFCWTSGKLRGVDLLMAAKWFLFRPSVRNRILRYFRRTRRSSRETTAVGSRLDTLPSKSEVFR